VIEEFFLDRVVAIGHLRGSGWDPEAGPAEAPANDENPTVRRFR
jgi:hypothetical protein